MKQTVVRRAQGETRAVRLARVVAGANGKAPAGVRLIDTHRSLTPGEIRHGKSLEGPARRVRARSS